MSATDRFMGFIVGLLYLFFIAYLIYYFVTGLGGTEYCKEAGYDGFSKKYNTEPPQIVCFNNEEPEFDNQTGKITEKRTYYQVEVEE